MGQPITSAHAFNHLERRQAHLHMPTVARFELAVHKRVVRGEALTADALGEMPVA